MLHTQTPPHTTLAVNKTKIPTETSGYLLALDKALLGLRKFFKFRAQANVMRELVDNSSLYSMSFLVCFQSMAEEVLPGLQVKILTLDQIRDARQPRITDKYADRGWCSCLFK